MFKRRSSSIILGNHVMKLIREVDDYDYMGIWKSNKENDWGCLTKDKIPDDIKYRGKNDTQIKFLKEMENYK